MKKKVYSVDTNFFCYGSDFFIDAYVAIGRKEITEKYI